MTDVLKEQVSSLPDSPGVYRFYNKQDILIYVGKAKSLKKRVSSYFNKQSQYNRKTEKLVSEIVKIEYTIAPSEFGQRAQHATRPKLKHRPQASPKASVIIVSPWIAP